MPVARVGAARVVAAGHAAQVGHHVAGLVEDAVAVVGAHTGGGLAVEGAGAGDGPVARHHLVVGVLDAEDELVLRVAQLGVPAQVGLVGEVVHLLPARVAAVDRGRVVRRAGGAVEARGEGRAGGHIGVAGLAVARQAVDAHGRRQLPLDARRQRVRVRRQEVVVLRVHRHVLGRHAVRHRAHQVGAQVRRLVARAQAVIVQRDRQVLVRLVQARQRHALAHALAGAAVRHALVVPQQVGAQRVWSVNTLLMSVLKRP